METGVERRGFSEVAPKPYGAHPFVPPGQRFDLPPASVGGTVVDEDNLVVRGDHGGELAVQFLERLLFVKDGDNGRELHGGIFFC